MNAKEITAMNRAYDEALSKFDVKALINFLEHWDRKTWKEFKKLNYAKQKKAMCNAIVDNEKHFNITNPELVKKAKAFLMEVKKNERH